MTGMIIGLCALAALALFLWGRALHHAGASRSHHVIPLSLVALGGIAYAVLGQGPEVQAHWHRKQAHAAIVQTLNEARAHPQRVFEALETLSTTLPSNAESLDALGQVYLQLKRPDLAVGPLEEALRLAKGGQARLQAHLALANALFLRDNGQATEALKAQVQAILSLSPGLAAGLNLQAILAFAEQDYAHAIEGWNQVLEQAQEPALEQTIMQAIAKAQAAWNPQLPEHQQRWVLQVPLALGENLDASEQATVFLVLKRQGQAMPWAAVKQSLGVVPGTLHISDIMALDPRPLLPGEQVTLIARVSESAEPIAQSGDWESVEIPLTVEQGTQMAQVLIIEQQRS